MSRTEGGARGNVVGWGTMLQTGVRGLESQWGQYIFFFPPQFMQFFPAALGPGVYSASNRNEYKALPVLKADNLNAICEPIV
jgi:hypothetical protein